ncbi:MAG: adenylate/guanylate cyclase domain-containing protein [Thermodesulfobacteriota bacterium]
MISRLPSAAPPLLVGLLIFLLVLGSRSAGLLQGLELALYDGLAALQPAAGPPPVTLVLIDEKDVEALGFWPPSDGVLARLSTLLLVHEPRAVGFDLYRDRPVAPGSEELDRLLATAPSLVWIAKFGGPGETAVAPPAALADPDRVGFSDLLLDPGGIVRRAALFLDDGETASWAFALQLARRYLLPLGVVPAPDPEEPELLQLGAASFRPLDRTAGGYQRLDARGYQILVDAAALAADLPVLSLRQVLAGDLDPRLIRERVVLVGVSAASIKDLFYTPRNRWQADAAPTPGVAIHAALVAQLIAAARGGRPPLAWAGEMTEILVLLAAALLGGWAGLQGPSPWRFLLLAGGGSAILAGTGGAALALGSWLPMAAPLVAFLGSATGAVAYGVSRERRQRQQLMEIFSRHVSDEVAATLWQERHQFLEGGRPRPRKLTATVLFTDLVGFTTLAEGLSPAALLAWLNEYLTAMAEEVSAHGGIVNKYIGDAIMAVFGVPLAREGDSGAAADAGRAVACALAMGRRLAQLNRRWHETGQPLVGMRIGIATGPLVAGSVGAARRLEYTVLGDTVNTAARLESYDKASFRPDPLRTPCRVLVTGATWTLVADRFQAESVGQIQLRGKGETVPVYRLHQEAAG